MTQEVGRAASPNRLSSSTGPANGSGPSGFDPARVRFEGVGLVKKRRAGNEQRASLRLKTYLCAQQGWRCFYCRRKMTKKVHRGRIVGTDATLDHVVKRAHGGPLSAANCVAACHDCDLYREYLSRNCATLRSRLRAARRWISGQLARLSPEGVAARAEGIAQPTEIPPQPFLSHRSGGKDDR